VPEWGSLSRSGRRTLELNKWKRDYTQWRPHSALSDRTVDEFASVAMQLSFALSAAERAQGLTQDAVCG